MLAVNGAIYYNAQLPDKASKEIRFTSDKSVNSFPSNGYILYTPCTPNIDTIIKVAADNYWSFTSTGEIGGSSGYTFQNLTDYENVKCTATLCCVPDMIKYLGGSGDYYNYNYYLNKMINRERQLLGVVTFFEPGMYLDYSTYPYYTYKPSNLTYTLFFNETNTFDNPYIPVHTTRESDYYAELVGGIQSAMRM